MNLPNIKCFTLTLDDENHHKWRFRARAFETKFKRPAEQYLEHFTTIRKIQDYCVEKSKQYNVPVLNNYNIEDNVTKVIDDVIQGLIEIKEAKKEKENGGGKPNKNQ